MPGGPAPGGGKGMDWMAIEAAARLHIASGAIRMAGLALPDFNAPFVNTRTKTCKSDADYEKEIAEQARRDQAMGLFQRSPGYRALEKRYVSEVSPDRRGILVQGLRKIQRQSLVEEMPTLAEILLDVKYQKRGRIVTYAEFYDGAGELVATCSNGAWTMYDTDAEAARKIGMAMLYNRAWGEAERAARRTEGACPQPAAAESGTGACFDVTA